jgi:hypothetical protein
LVFGPQLGKFAKNIDIQNEKKGKYTQNVAEISIWAAGWPPLI